MVAVGVAEAAAAARTRVVVKIDLSVMMRVPVFVVTRQYTRFALPTEAQVDACRQSLAGKSLPTKLPNAEDRIGLASSPWPVISGE